MIIQLNLMEAVSNGYVSITPIDFDPYQQLTFKTITARINI